MFKGAVFWTRARLAAFAIFVSKIVPTKELFTLPTKNQIPRVITAKALASKTMYFSPYQASHFQLLWKWKYGGFYISWHEALIQDAESVSRKNEVSRCELTYYPVTKNYRRKEKVVIAPRWISWYAHVRILRTDSLLEARLTRIIGNYITIASDFPAQLLLSFFFFARDYPDYLYKGTSTILWWIPRNV